MSPRKRGFTLIEIMIGVAIIGLLAVMAIPSFIRMWQKSQASRTAHDIQVFAHAFAVYAQDQGNYPPDSHIVLPNALMKQYIDEAKWLKPTAIGGTYNWEGPDNYPYAGVSIYESDAPLEAMEFLDDFLDDGNLGTGQFQKTPNGRFTYILE